MFSQFKGALEQLFNSHPFPHSLLSCTLCRKFLSFHYNDIVATYPNCTTTMVAGLHNGALPLGNAGFLAKKDKMVVISPLSRVYLHIHFTKIDHNRKNTNEKRDQVATNVDLDRNEETQVPRACSCYLTPLPLTKLMLLVKLPVLRSPCVVILLGLNPTSFLDA